MPPPTRYAGAPAAPMTHSDEHTPYWLKALGRGTAPAVIELRGHVYRLERVFKHDFFALTACYAGEAGKAVLKIGRRQSLFGLPLSWIGRLHARHEQRVLQELEDLDVVPRFLGAYGKHGFAHEYVEGHDLRKGEHVPDDFFDRLRSGLAEIHRRGMAYVDLEKCENVLVGDDGRPYLFDFQIAWNWPRRWGSELWPLRWIRGRLQQADRYHVSKLQRRTRPDQLTPDELEASRRRPPHVKAYSVLTRPLTRMRRRVLNRIDPVKKRGERGRQHEAPQAQGKSTCAAPTKVTR